MAQQTKGEFLKEKFANMASWVASEVGQENLPDGVLSGITGRSEVEVTMLASTLHSNKSMVDQRNWAGLGALAGEHIPAVQSVITAINQRADMHGKFWRYMDLFVEVVSE